MMTAILITIALYLIVALGFAIAIILAGIARLNARDHHQHETMLQELREIREALKRAADMVIKLQEAQARHYPYQALDLMDNQMAASYGAEARLGELIQDAEAFVLRLSGVFQLIQRSATFGRQLRGLNSGRPATELPIGLTDFSDLGELITQKHLVN